MQAYVAYCVLTVSLEQAFATSYATLTVGTQ